MSEVSRALSALSRAACALSVLSLCLWAPGCGTPQEEQPQGSPAVTARVRHTIAAHPGAIWRVAFSPDSRLLASCSPDKTVKLWRVADGSLAQTLAHPEGVTNVAFSPDGR